jgi:rod shape determining protein RodA
MALTVLRRKPDSGLGNIHASPSAPSRNIDWVLMSTQAALSLIGLAIIYSATRTKNTNAFLFVTRQEIFLIAAVLTMVAVMATDYSWWRERARFLYAATILALILVRIAGTLNEGARLSFDLGQVRLQPAEFAKFTVLLLLAGYLSEEGKDEQGLPYHRFITGLLMVGGPAALVILQPDLGTASVLITLAMGVLLVAGAKARYILMITVLSAATVAAAFIAPGVVNQYQKDRLLVFVDPDRCEVTRDLCFQGENALKAIATGGITGKGWLNGPLTNARSDIPVQWADFPMTAVGEQFGLVGMGAVLGLFALLLLRIWRIALLSRDMMGTYICAGVFTMILWQVFQNLAMALKLMPITGLPMPFVSYGGSSVVSFFAMLGLVQSVHMRRYR